MLTTTTLISKSAFWTVLLYFIVIHVTEGADILCKGPLGYDVSPLIGSWTFKASNQSCPAAPTKINATCDVTLAFCKEIPTICNGSSSACVKASNYTGNNDSSYFPIGEYTQNPFSLNGSFIMATFGSVSLNNSAASLQCNLTTIVTFNCNLQSKWTMGSQGLTPIPKSANIKSKFVRKPSGECLYNITADFEGACINVVPSLPVTGLSAGTVLIIIFFVSISVYCISGCTCNFVRGYKGPELIPHSQFWIDLPVLIADGMIFTFRCCKQEPTAYDSI